MSYVFYRTIDTEENMTEEQKRALIKNIILDKMEREKASEYKEIIDSLESFNRQLIQFNSKMPSLYSDKLRTNEAEIERYKREKHEALTSIGTEKKYFAQPELHKSGIKMGGNQMVLEVHTRSLLRGDSPEHGFMDSEQRMLNVDKLYEFVANTLEQHGLASENKENNECDVVWGFFESSSLVDYIDHGKITMAFDFDSSDKSRFSAFLTDLTSKLNESFEKGYRENLKAKHYDYLFPEDRYESREEGIEAEIKSLRIQSDYPYSAFGKVYNYYEELSKGMSLDAIADSFEKKGSSVLFKTNLAHLKSTGESELSKEIEEWRKGSFGGSVNGERYSFNEDGYDGIARLTGQAILDENPELAQAIEQEILNSIASRKNESEMTM